MKVAFLTAVAYAALGFLYAPGWSSTLALVFVATACSPLLLAAAADREAVRYSPPGFLFFWALVAIGVMNLGIIAANVGREPAELLSTEGISAAAIDSTIRRYEEHAPSGNPVLLAASLFLIFRVGAAHVGTLKRLIAFSPVIAYTVLTTEKLPALLAIVFFLSGVVMATPPERAVRRFSKNAAVFVAIGAAIGALAVMLRTGFDSESSEVAGKLIHYVLSPYAAFGRWLHDFGMNACCGLGEQTFIGPLNALGIATRKQGVFEEYFLVNDMPGNIFTVWRFLVEDFSIVGPLLLNAVLAASFMAVQSLGWRFAGQPIKLFALVGSMLSLATSVFAYNSVTLAFALAAGYTFIATHPFPRLPFLPAVQRSPSSSAR